jgi:hypothetical protein
MVGTIQTTTAVQTKPACKPQEAANNIVAFKAAPVENRPVAARETAAAIAN